MVVSEAKFNCPTFGTSMYNSITCYLWRSVRDVDHFSRPDKTTLGSVEGPVRLYFVIMFTVYRDLGHSDRNCFEDEMHGSKQLLLIPNFSVQCGTLTVFLRPYDTIRSSVGGP